MVSGRESEQTVRGSEQTVRRYFLHLFFPGTFDHFQSILTVSFSYILQNTFS